MGTDAILFYTKTLQLANALKHDKKYRIGSLNFNILSHCTHCLFVCMYVYIPIYYKS